VARAICIADGEDPDTPVLCAINAYRDYVFQWTLYIPEARASIQAMREPTDEMVIAGMRAYDTSRHIWAAMVDEALKETK
jgi:hypothetical protein